MFQKRHRVEIANLVMIIFRLFCVIVDNKIDAFVYLQYVGWYYLMLLGIRSIQELDRSRTVDTGLHNNSALEKPEDCDWS